MLNAWILCSNLIALLAPVTMVGSDGAPATSPAILDGVCSKGTIILDMLIFCIKRNS